MFACASKSVSRVLSLALLAMLPVAAAAQAAPAAKGSSSDAPAPKWDIFAGYSYLAPHGTVNTLLPNQTTVSGSYDAVNVGGIFSYSYYFNRYVGLQGEVGVHEWGVQKTNDVIANGTQGNNDGFTTIWGGAIFRYPMENVTPFAHALFGGAYIDGPVHNPFTWGPAVTLGGGMDYLTPWFNHRFSIRLFQADYEYMHVNFGSGVWGGSTGINAARLSTGFVIHSAGTPPPPVTLACSATPSWVYPGDPVTVTATAGNLDPKLHAIYSFTGTGVTAGATTATVATGALAPGSYTVNCGVKEGKPGKEGLKPWETASATATFEVRQFEPPSISCTANPTTIYPEQTSTVTAKAVSPQNRPLTITYSATAGSINGSGSTATFNPAGAPLGAVGIKCNVSDDKGQTASADTGVTIIAHPVIRTPHVAPLCSGPITFDKDKKRPTRVDNEAKACLDQVTSALKNDSTANAVVVGESTVAERTPKKAKHPKPVEDFAAERAVNTKDYLVNEEQSGIDASRITVRTGSGDAKAVENYLVPAGANFDSDVQGTKPVDEGAVKKLTRKAIPVPGEKPVHKKHAKHAAAGASASVKPPKATAKP